MQDAYQIRRCEIKGPRVVRLDEELTVPITRKEKSRLELKYISSSNENNAKMRVFDNSYSAQKHILKHVLGHGESSIWSLLLPSEGEVIARVLNSRTSKHVSIGDVSLVDLQMFYNSYVNVIESEIKIAESFGTVAEDSQSSFYLGLTGLFIVVRNNIVKTAYFPMWSDEKKFVELNCVSCVKKKRDKKRRQKAMEKRSSKGTPERRIFKSGLRATVTVFRNTKSTDKDFNTRQRMAGLAADNMPMKYHQWLAEYLALYAEERGA